MTGNKANKQFFQLKIQSTEIILPASTPSLRKLFSPQIQPRDLSKLQALFHGHKSGNNVSKKNAMALSIAE